MMGKRILIALCVFNMLVGCGKTYTERFTLEQDGDIKLLTYPQVQEIDEHQDIDQNEFIADVEYFQLMNSGNETALEIENLEVHRRLSIENNGFVERV